MIKIIDFYADWCGQCKKMMPIIDDLSKDYDVLKINVDTNIEMAKKYNVSTLPTILLINNDIELDKINGLTTKNKIIEKIHRIEDEK